jgi:hypothetical protein
MWKAFKTRVGQNFGWVATAVLVGLAALWLFQRVGGTEATVRAGTEEGEAAPAARAPAPLTPQPSVPVARRDTGGRLQMGELRLEDPLEVDAAVHVGASDTADATLLVRHRRIWLPELRPPSAGLSVDVMEGSELPVTVTPTPRPLFDWQPRPLAGIGASTDLGGPRLYLGADLARAGPLHAQLGLTTSFDPQAPALDLAPAAGLRLRSGGLMLTAGYQLRAGRPFAALSYRF